VEALRHQGYGSNPELVGIAGGSPSLGWVTTLMRGAYVRMPHLIGGRPSYQKVRRKPGSGRNASIGEVIFSQVYISWCPRSARWRIADRPKESNLRCYACSPLDYRRPHLPDIQGNWFVRENQSSDWVEDPMLSVVSLAGKGQAPNDP